MTAQHCRTAAPRPGRRVVRALGLALGAVLAAPPAVRGDEDHPPVPPVYAKAHIPVRAWTDRKLIARGKEIYTARCAVCHGERGDGKGPAGVNLKPPPADFTDAKMVAEMAGNYWFWRVSEGGLVEPFLSRGSAMPAWKGELSVNDRQAVIVYQHTLSGHKGPHTPREHPEMGKGHGD